MANRKPNNSSNGDHEEIIPGNTILNKLLNELSPADREFILRLMVELGIPNNDPMHPFLVALQYYVSILRDIPAAMKAAADDSLRKAAAIYGTFQSNIENVTAKIAFEVDRIDGLRVQWGEDAEALLPKFKAVFDATFDQAIQAADEVLQKKVAGYQKRVDEINEKALQSWSEQLESTRSAYLRDVLRQGLIWASGALLMTAAAIGWAAYQKGSQDGFRDGYNASVQDVYKAFGGKRGYECAKAVWKDNTFQCRLLPPQS
jgi:F0F1-type ATP synthase membrane subunit b/b'